MAKANDLSMFEPVQTDKNDSFSKSGDVLEKTNNFEPVQKNENDTFYLDSHDLFIRDLKSYSIPATREMNEDLLRRYRNGEDVIDTIIIANTPLVIKVAQKYARFLNSMEFDDLISEGIIGLYTAVERFDPDMNYSFSTYAFQWIRQSITRAISKKDAVCHIPVYVLDDERSYHNFLTAYKMKHGKTPTEEEVKEALHLTDERFNYASYAHMILNVESLNVKFSDVAEDGSEIECQDAIASKDPSVEDIILKQNQEEVILDVIERFVQRLPQKQRDKTRDIIYRRFGVGYATYSEEFKAIAADYGLSRQAVHQRVDRFLNFARNDSKMKRYFYEEVTA